MRVLSLCHRHEVGDLGNSILGEESREQHVRVRNVQLLLSGPTEDGSDLEPAPSPVVEYRGENGWGVEVRETHEVDRTVHTDEGDGVEVANDPVILNRLVCHRPYVSDQ